jgi:hypothetical protein
MEQVKFVLSEALNAFNFLGPLAVVRYIQRGHVWEAQLSEFELDTHLCDGKGNSELGGHEVRVRS